MITPLTPLKGGTIDGLAGARPCDWRARFARAPFGRSRPIVMSEAVVFACEC